MRKKLSTILLAVVMAVSLLLCAPLPTFAASGGTPEITWLSASGRPYYYNEEFGWLTLYDSQQTRRYYSTIDLATGERVEYDVVAGFSDGMAMVGKYDSDGSMKNGYIDTTGAVVVPLGEYDGVGVLFSDGLARVAKRDASGDAKWGYIDTTGAVVVPLEYRYAFDFYDGLAWVQGNGDEIYGYIDTTGVMVVPFGEYSRVGSFSDGLAAVGKGGKYGYIDTTGKLVISLEYDNASYFSDGLARVVKYDEGANASTIMWSLIDTTGAVVITLPFEYDDNDDFSDGLARVMKYDRDTRSRKYGYIDTTGKLAVPLEYDDAGNFSEGLARVMKYDEDGNKKYGFIDKTGAVVVPLEYDGAGFVTGGGNDTVMLCYVQKGMSYGIFENPYYVLEVPSDSEPGDTEEPGGESPTPSNPGSQNPQNSTNPGNGSNPSGGDNSNGGGFPVVPVVSAAGGATVAAVVVVLVLKKKK